MPLITSKMPETWEELEETVADILGECGMESKRAVNLRLPRGSVEEFAVALEGNIERATALAERIRSSIAALLFNFDGHEVRVTSSLGIAEVYAGEDLQAALKRGDTTLYSAKFHGRNRSVLAPAPTRRSSPAAAPNIGCII